MPNPKWNSSRSLSGHRINQVAARCCQPAPLFNKTAFRFAPIILLSYVAAKDLILRLKHLTHAALAKLTYDLVMAQHLADR